MISDRRREPKKLVRVVDEAYAAATGSNQKEDGLGLYKEYDRAGLDAQYNNRVRVPGHGDHIGRWAQASARVRERGQAHLDVPYGTHPRQRFDIFPARAALAPALVYIHGGYWHMLDKSSFSFPATTMAEAGVAFAAVGYPLAPEFGVGDIVESLRQALVWLWRNGAEYGVDRDSLSVAGHSAGGHLAAMMMVTDWSKRGSDIPEHPIKGGTAISGIYDLEPIRLSYLNDVLGLDEETVKRNSPIHNMAAAAGPLNLAVGGRESDEFHRQQRDIHGRWSGQGLPGRSLDLPGHNHFSILDGLEDPTSELFRLVVETCLVNPQ
jgi:arylformamidase